MKFKPGDIIKIVDPRFTSSYLNTPLMITRIEGESYYIDPDVVGDSDTGYLFQEGSSWCDKAIKMNYYKTKLGRILYGKRY